MKRKEILIERKKKLEKRKEKLMERANASEDATEVRGIYEQMQEVIEDIKDVEKELEAIKEESKGEGSGEENKEGEEEKPGEDAARSVSTDTSELRGAQILGAFRQKNNLDQRGESDPADTLEYRNAFMNYVCRGTRIPEKLMEGIQTRDDGPTTTSDTGAVIPTTILKEIIQKMESYGNVYALVKKLNVQGGVAIPILSIKPEATWIGESNSSKDKKLSANESITFSYFGVECKISQTLLANVTTLDAFQKLFVPLATEAIVKALEIAIFNGNGSTQPLGILNDSRILEDNVIELSPQDMTWAGWHKVKGKMKKAYRSGVFFMNQATFDEKIDGMQDANGQPVGRTNYGINGEETYRFMGKNVETVEDGCLPSYDDAKEGEVFAVFMLPKDYIINSNMQMRTVKWEDHDNNQVKNKCILICDGKLGDTNGVLLIKKGKGTADSTSTDAGSETEPQG